MLNGFDLPVSDLNLSPIFSQHFGPNPAIVVLVAVAVIGLAASMWPGWKSDVVRLASAGIGNSFVFAASLFVSPGLVFNGLALFVHGGTGATIIALALGLSLFLDGEA